MEGEAAISSLDISHLVASRRDVAVVECAVSVNDALAFHEVEADAGQTPQSHGVLAEHNGDWSGERTHFDFYFNWLLV